VRVWVNRTAGGEFLGGCRLPTIVITCRRRVPPPRLNGVRVVHGRATEVLGGPVVGPRWLITERREPVRVRTCRGKRR
jgi:hypothetical protein